MSVAAVIASITLRQLLSRRRTLLLLLLGAVLVVMSIVFRLSGGASSEAGALSWTVGVLEALSLTTLVPLVALIFGTGAIGSEIEDGTAVHLLTKPVARWQVGLVKYAVAAACAAVISGAPTLVAGVIGAGEPGVPLGFTAGAVAGSAVYVAIFLALSLVTSRSFIVGLGYVLIWEGLLAGLFPGIATLSVRQQSISIARTLADAFSTSISDLDPRLPIGTAVVAAVVFAALALVVATGRLARLEIAGEVA